MVSTGTKALLGYGRNITKNVNPFAPSGVRAISPNVAASQDIASTNSSSTPPAASQSSAVADGRKPMRNATTIITEMAQPQRTKLAATWPPSTAAPLTSIDRNRSTMPSFMSSVTLIAVIAATKPQGHRGEHRVQVAHAQPHTARGHGHGVRHGHPPETDDSTSAG